MSLDQSASTLGSPISEEHPTNGTQQLQLPADWHRERRRSMMQKYRDEIAPLEQATTFLGVPLLVLTSGSLFALAVSMTDAVPLPLVILLALFPGSMLSLWQLQLLHDLIHGLMLNKKKTTVLGMEKKRMQDALLFWGSLPCYFGYYLYLKNGHMSHHAKLGQHDLLDLFESDQIDFEDGDVLFTSHRMHLTGDYGPKVPIPGGDNHFKMSISRSGFYFWKEGEAIRNAILFAASFVYERMLLGLNDAVVAILGRNLFFLRKPDTFHETNANYSRVATALRLALWTFVSYKAVLFLFLAETLWCLPPHPASVMFVTNHGSKTPETADAGGGTVCEPTQSTYAGFWYSLFTLNTNCHCEHHDFPAIPLHHLHRLRRIAPEFYQQSDDDLPKLLEEAFAYPDFYACMNASPTVVANIHER